MDQLIISFDGLQSQDVEPLSRLLPRSWRFLSEGTRHGLESGALTSAQAIWAQILTGEPWYKNGCAGYSKPTTSLNTLSVFSEQDLVMPVKLLSSGAKESPDAVINVPLLQSKSGRVWLSDGSLPTNLVVSPRKLLAEEPFSAYIPRPFQDIAATFHHTRDCAVRCVDTEIIRTDCVASLLDRFEFRTFVWRITVFDHLSHLFGMDVLSQRDLFFFESLEALMEKIDSVLYRMLSSQPALRWLLLSAFSHVPCRAMLNLNSRLKQGELLQYEKSAASSTALERRAAIAGIVGEQKLVGFELRSMEGRLDLEHTKVASPVSGSVFANCSERFENGAVCGTDFGETVRQAKMYLEKTLSTEFGSVAVEAMPEGVLVAPGTPDLVISVPGVEFHNTEDQGTRSYDRPITTHSSRGFLLASKFYGRLSDRLRSTEIASLTAKN